MDLTQLDHFSTIMALIIGILSVARTARLLIHDAFPPTIWLRLQWFGRFGEEGWGKLLKCHYCITPYLAVGMAAWFYFGGEHWTWWVINGVWGFSYISAVYVSYDEPVS